MKYYTYNIYRGKKDIIAHYGVWLVIRTNEYLIYMTLETKTKCGLALGTSLTPEWWTQTEYSNQEPRI